MNDQVETNKEFRWYVHEGQMHSAWVIGFMDIDVKVQPGENHTDLTGVALNILTQGNREMNMPKDPIAQLVKRPGRWYYLSGCAVVHSDDLHATREDAAEAYKFFLLGQ